MPSTAKVYQVNDPTAPLVPGTIERRDLRDNDVAIEVSASGFCMSDVHTARGHWGPIKYPIIVGHEIVGKVTDSKDPRYKAGDYVGVGCMVDSCLKCGQCKHHEEQFCEEGFTPTYNGVDKVDGTCTAGGYSSSIVVKGDFVLKMPENLDPFGAAPLLCAGITTYSPLARFGTGPGKKVLVAGLGGLGHMAVKIANAMGAEVTVSSRSESKGKEAKSLGAHNLLINTDPEQMKKAANSFDIIIDTIAVDHSLQDYVTLLKPYGVMALAGHIGPTNFNTAGLVMGNKVLAGSLIGGIKETQEMLDFCGKHDIVATVEKVSYKDINTIWDRLEKSDVKYRFVFDPATL